MWTRKKKTAVVLTVTAATAMVAIEAYRRGWIHKGQKNLKNAVEKTQKVYKEVTQTVQDTTQVLCTVAKDAKEFLSSNAEEVPQSIKQVIKLASCTETAEGLQNHIKTAVSTFTSDRNSPAASASCSAEKDATSSLSITDIAAEKLFSEKGTGFVTVVASNIAKQAITTLLDRTNNDGPGEDALDKYKDIILSQEGQLFIRDMLTNVVAHAMTVYLDKTSHINTFDELFHSAVKPQYKPFVEDLCVKLCKVWTETIMIDTTKPSRAEHILYDTGSNSKLCTPRDYPAIHDSHRSPVSVCSGVPVNSCEDTFASTTNKIGPIVEMDHAQNNWVKDILTTAASDKEVRSFLITMASSSSAATTRVVLDTFAPSWLVKRGEHADDRSAYRKATSTILFYTVAFLFLFLSIAFYRSSSPISYNFKG